MKKLIILFVTLVFSSVLMAASKPASVSLHSISATKIQEQTGDELYMAVTSYPRGGKSTHYRIPEFPLHWFSKQLNRVKNVELWKGNIEEGKSVTLVFSLIEQDAPPWDADDLMGTIRLTIKNVKGKLKQRWKIPNSSKKPEKIKMKKQTVYRFKLLGDNTFYTVYLNTELG